MTSKAVGEFHGLRAGVKSSETVHVSWACPRGTQGPVWVTPAGYHFFLISLRTQSHTCWWQAENLYLAAAVKWMIQWYFRETMFHTL